MEPLGTLSSMTQKPRRPGQKGKVVINKLLHKGTGPLPRSPGQETVGSVSTGCITITRYYKVNRKHHPREGKCLRATFSQPALSALAHHNFS